MVDGDVDNDRSLELLARTAVSHAEAGADIVAPEPFANEALPGMARFDVPGLLHEVQRLAASGVGAVMLFGVPEVKAKRFPLM